MSDFSTALRNDSANRTSDRPRALVTGASKGIGREIASMLVRHGYCVLGTSRNPEASFAEDRVPGVTYLGLDLANPESIARCAAEAGELDVLVNNAGQSQIGPLEQLPPGSIERLFQVNVFGQIRLTQLCLPAMRARHHGTIVMIGSLMAEFPVPFQSTYAATKLALRGFVQALRTEVAPFGIKATLVQPGYYDTQIRLGRERVLDDDSPYADGLRLVNERVDGAGSAGGDPRHVAEKVWKVLGESCPAPVYSVGSHGPALVFAKRFVSRRRVERLIARRYGL
jgi:NAD(P)-dependent dehydrogenase (short-subunit alcohol dehydrogenase family)